MNNHIYSTLFKIQERKSDRRSREKKRIAQLHVVRKEFITFLIARDVTAGVPKSGENVWANIGMGVLKLAPRKHFPAFVLKPKYHESRTPDLPPEL